jgi:hypothetical protein
MVYYESWRQLTFAVDLGSDCDPRSGRAATGRPHIARHCPDFARRELLASRLVVILLTRSSLSWSFSPPSLLHAVSSASDRTGERCGTTAGAVESGAPEPPDGGREKRELQLRGASSGLARSAPYRAAGGEGEGEGEDTRKDERPMAIGVLQVAMSPVG